MAKRRIGILTGGGDVPGLNAVIKSVTYRGSEDDFEVIGFRRGWEGLTNVNLDDPESRAHYVIPLDRANTRTGEQHHPARHHRLCHQRHCRAAGAGVVVQRQNRSRQLPGLRPVGGRRRALGVAEFHRRADGAEVW